jgi:hypothetical protein
MSFQIGQTVLLNGKEYKIVETKARSYILEREGKRYKATAAKMTKIQDQNAAKESAPVVSSLERRLAYARIFNKDAKMPETEAEIMVYFENLRCELSPENLSCDGEASASQVRNRLHDIKTCWKELEAKLGRKVIV